MPKPLFMSGNQKQVKPVWPYVVETSVKEAAMEKVQGTQVTLMRFLGATILLWSCVPAIVRDEGHAGARETNLAPPIMGCGEVVT